MCCLKLVNIGVRSHRFPSRLEAAHNQFVVLTTVRWLCFCWGCFKNWQLNSFVCFPKPQAYQRNRPKSALIKFGFSHLTKFKSATKSGWMNSAMSHRTRTRWVRDKTESESATLFPSFAFARERASGRIESCSLAVTRFFECFNDFKHNSHWKVVKPSSFTLNLFLLPSFEWNLACKINCLLFSSP